MLSLKTAIGLTKNLSRFEFSRQIFVSSRKQVDSEESSTNADETPTPITVGLEKSLFLRLTAILSVIRLQYILLVYAAINSVTLLGRVGSNPVKRGSLEHPVVTFSLATHSNYSYPNGFSMLNSITSSKTNFFISFPKEKSAKRLNGTEFVFLNLT